MTRRTRRQRAKARWWTRSLLILGALLLLAAGVGYTALRQYLQSESFRRFLSAKVGDALSITGSFSPFRWDGLAVDTSGFDGRGEAAIRRLTLERIHTEIGFGGLRRGVWELRDSHINRLEIDIDTTREPAPDTRPTPPPASSPSREEKSAWLPDKIELHGLKIADLRADILLKDGAVSATGLTVTLDPGDSQNSYLADIAGGHLTLPRGPIPSLALGHAHLRYQDDTLFITSARATALQNAILELTGEIDLDAGRHVIEGRLSRVRCDELFKDDWAKRFSGDVSTTFTLDARTSSPFSKGTLHLENGVLTALPLLDALAAYADTRRFRILNLNEARTDWRRENDRLTLTNLVLATDGLMRLEGRLTVDGDRLDGLFRLGLVPGILSSIPGAETDVFLPGERGLLWTTLRLSGTTRKPREDLTERLIAAAGLRMFEQLPGTSEKVLRFTRSLLGDTPSDSIRKHVEDIEKGVEILEKSGDAIRDAGAILDGILGRGKRDRDDRK